MSDLLVRPGSGDGEPLAATAREADGTLTRITPQSAGWGHVGFEVLALEDGRPARRDTGERELCVVPVSGHCVVSSAHGEWALARVDPWSGPPEAAYLPPATALELNGEGEVALCWAPAAAGAPPRLLTAPEPVTRGTGTYERRIHNVLMGDREADSLLVTEVITPAGHWSSFPPHKHDRDALPDESLLEETYYFRVSPAQGFGIARVYTEDGDLDETIAVRDRDTVLVPRGYHTVSAPPGYDLYYLNVMAGPMRTWAIANDPDHEWLLR